MEVLRLFFGAIVFQIGFTWCVFLSLWEDTLKKEYINNAKTHDVDASASKIMNFIIINRWIGIDSLILIYNSEKKGFDLFFRSLNEKKKANSDLTFYENEFGLSNVKLNFEYGKTILKGNTLPGIITFLYYHNQTKPFL